MSIVTQYCDNPVRASKENCRFLDEDGVCEYTDYCSRMSIDIEEEPQMRDEN